MVALPDGRMDPFGICIFISMHSFGCGWLFSVLNKTVGGRVDPLNGAFEVHAVVLAGMLFLLSFPLPNEITVH